MHNSTANVCAVTLTSPLDSLNPSLEFSPPTPSDDNRSDLNGSPDNLQPARVRETKSGPATPSGSRENHNPLDWEDNARLDSSSNLSAADTRPGSSGHEDGTAGNGSHGRGLPLPANEGSSDDVDTLAAMLISDGFSD